MLVEQSKNTLRVQLWQVEPEDFDDADAKPLIMLVWKMNTKLQIRDTGFKARRFLNAPEASPPCFQHSKVLNGA